ncbi:hypothetical protein COCCADRAFT_39810 [Bipolaris zeicola 26-R-13]|uniref:amidase n=1 Tax=Cochliobolus carbonum (strain 26-R-13) TaxID=930089 RepID=W6Y4B5_COCC2|nr:uncharacterized protein COCCADRAFT_39810 [Bipolaris zeicola 26-R-13]EUC29879.1 hypothetical protein COCCADRAFT_39810 [Bipolaris zeicola 26-R-13]
MAASTTTSWESTVAAKQQSCRDKLPKEWLLPSAILQMLQTPFEEHPHRINDMDIPRKSGILTEKELDITEKYTVTQLLSKLKSGELSALDVTLAFSKRAAIAQQLLSCLTETYFPEAQARAKFLDDERAQGRIVGPLHGLPISVKDGFQVAGSDASIGFVSFLSHPPSEKNSPLVDILLELGAVIYVKTNIPQTLMTGDSQNNIFGRTLNPVNTFVTAGGSSGGEGSLVGFRGSPLGIGTDIAGSIRIPSLCCGTYGFKPTTSRVPDGGQASPALAGMNFFKPCAGPLANDIHALNTLCSSVMSVRPALYDTSALDVPWMDLSGSPSPEKLRIGVVSEDPTFPLHPPVKRALAEAVRLLEAQGHYIYNISAPKAHVADAVAVGFEFFFLDDTGAKHIDASGEPLIRSVKQGMEAWGAFKNSFLDDIAHLEGVKRVAALNVKRHIIADEWRSLWKDEKLDVVIGPSAQHTAVRHDTYGLPPYTLLLNVLDYPACVIPFGKSSSKLDPEPLVMGPGQCGPNYEPELMDSLPTSIQVYTNKMRDEECLKFATVIDGILNPK